VHDYAEHSVLMWAEANKDIVCKSLEQMADIQEAAVYADVLADGGEHEIGLETFAMSGALHANPNLRYDFTKYRSPWAARRETEASRAIRESWERGASWTKRHLAAAQEPADAKPAVRGRKRGTQGVAKSAPKRKTAPSKK
jgi:hypothetical protein